MQKDRFLDLEVDGRITHFGETGWKSVDWIRLAQDTSLWRRLVNTTMDNNMR
jgi:hypothetical protein